MRVALAAGATPVATAGGPPKRSLLRRLGVACAVASRDTSFVQDLTLAVGGFSGGDNGSGHGESGDVGVRNRYSRDGASDNGPGALVDVGIGIDVGSAIDPVAGTVDVVLNALTSPGMVAASLACLSPAGRFVELAKRDVWGRGRAACERPDALCSLLAIDFLPDQEIGALLARLADGLARGVLSPPPTAHFALSSSAAALRRLAQASGVGKVVVASPPRGPVGGAAPSAPGAAQAGGSGVGGARVAVTGGTGALGLLTAQWLLATGSVSALLLIARSARVMAGGTAGAGGAGGTGSTAKAWAQLAAGAAAVTAIAADVACAGDAAEVWAPRGRSKSVDVLIHAAGVLTDAMLPKQSLEMLRRCVAMALDLSVCLWWQALGRERTCRIWGRLWGGPWGGRIHAGFGEVFGAGLGDGEHMRGRIVPAEAALYERLLGGRVNFVSNWI
eukprot:355669-Chlamydomonas_euryale.AAC.4